MISLIDGEGEQVYTYDRRGNLTAVSKGEELLKAFTFDAANRMTEALRIKDGVEKRAEYSYDAFGNRIGQDIYSRKAGSGVQDTGRREPKDPERQIRYTLDLTRQYHNLLVSEGSAGQKEQVFYWDGNVAAMEEAGHDSYYLQDDLGSPMLLADEEGEIRESYAFDEFGQSFYHSLESQLQPFGYTGYQMEEAGGLYFAQARRYDAGAGRFVSEDKIAGFTALPQTLNRYSYCWNQPMEHVDLNGRFPWLIIPILAVIALSCTGCGSGMPECPEGVGKSADELELSNGYVPIYDYGYYNTDEYLAYTNCYSYAFGMLVNPITGEKFPERGNQPGLLSNDEYYLNMVETGDSSEYIEHYLAGTDESDANLVNTVKAGMDAVGLNFVEYEEGMTGGKRIVLVLIPCRGPYDYTCDYHWYVYDEESQTWGNKNGPYWATNNELYYGWFNESKYGAEITDYSEAARMLGYDHIVGEFYLTRKDGECIE